MTLGALPTTSSSLLPTRQQAFEKLSIGNTYLGSLVCSPALRRCILRAIVPAKKKVALSHAVVDCLPTPAILSCLEG